MTQTEHSSPEEDPKWIEKTAAPMLQLYELADVLGYPHEWIMCPACHAFSWRIPPHVFSPCPMVLELAGAATLKIETERNQLIRGTGAMEQALEDFKRRFGTDDDE